MLSVKLVRSLVLGESLVNNNPLYHHHHHHHHDTHDDDDDILTHVEYDADNNNDDDDDHHHQQHQQNHTHFQKLTKSKTQNSNKKKRKKMPLLLFIPTQELISDTFRLATIAREIGMNFYPTNSLSHLLFSWPSSQSSSSSSTLPSTTSSSSPFSPFSTPSSSNNRPSVSSNATTSTSVSSVYSTFWSHSSTIPNDAVPLPFPSLSTVSSISLLRYFVSLSKNLFKLVFLEIEPNSRFNFGCNYDYDCVPNVALISRVSGKQVNSMGEFSRVLAGNGWSLFRSSENNKTTSCSSSLSSVVYMFRKEDWNRIRAKKMINGDNRECRVRELRLPALDFEKGVPLRILQYILLMTDDLFYLA